MQIQFNLDKKHLFIIAFVGIILAIGLGFAYKATPGSTNIASTIGHSVDEIDWAQTIQGQIKIDGSTIAPATSGVTQSGSILRISDIDTGAQALDIGLMPASPFGTWIQTGSVSNLGINYPLLLNPNGGNIGLGTTNPTTKLDVVGAIHASGDICSGGGNCLNSVGGSSWTTSGSNVYRASGSVGIGTSTPHTSLEVPLSGIQIGSSGTVGDNFHFVSDLTGGVRGLRIFNGNYGSGTHLITILSDGKFGIGTNTPSVALEVNGDIRSNSITTGAIYSTSLTSGAGTITAGSIVLQPTGGLGGSNEIRTPGVVRVGAFGSGPYLSSTTIVLARSASPPFTCNDASGGAMYFDTSHEYGAQAVPCICANNGDGSGFHWRVFDNMVYTCEGAAG